MKTATEREARAAVHIAATVMRAAGLCKTGGSENCKKSDCGSAAKFSTCIDCIERWLYKRARERVGSSVGGSGVMILGRGETYTPPVDLPSDPTSRSPWIRVEDRLPPDDNAVLAVVSGRSRSILFDNAVEMAVYDAFEDAWILESFPRASGYTVTHWTPIPAAPGGEGNG